MLRWTGLGGKNSSSNAANASKEVAVGGNGGSLQAVGSDGLTEDERLALEEMDRFYGMENVSLSLASCLISVAGSWCFGARRARYGAARAGENTGDGRGRTRVRSPSGLASASVRTLLACDICPRRNERPLLARWMVSSSTRYCDFVLVVPFQASSKLCHSLR